MVTRTKINYGWETNKAKLVTEVDHTVERNEPQIYR